METYKTKDIYEATALLANNGRLIQLEKEGNFYWFVFENLDMVKKMSDSYWRNELSVLAKDYSDAFRTLKDRLFSQP